MPSPSPLILWIAVFARGCANFARCSCGWWLSILFRLRRSVFHRDKASRVASELGSRIDVRAWQEHASSFSYESWHTNSRRIRRLQWLIGIKLECIDGVAVVEWNYFLSIDKCVYIMSCSIDGTDSAVLLFFCSNISFSQTLTESGTNVP